MRYGVPSVSTAATLVVCATVLACTSSSPPTEQPDEQGRGTNASPRLDVGLELPRSNAVVPHSRRPDSVRVTVTHEAIRVDGSTVFEGEDSWMPAGSTRRPALPRLVDAISEAFSEAETSHRRVTVAFDRWAPYGAYIRVRANVLRAGAPDAILVRDADGTELRDIAVVSPKLCGNPQYLGHLDHFWVVAGQRVKKKTQLGGEVGPNSLLKESAEEKTRMEAGEVADSDILEALADQKAAGDDGRASDGRDARTTSSDGPRSRDAGDIGAAESPDRGASRGGDEPGSPVPRAGSETEEHDAAGSGGSSCALGPRGRFRESLRSKPFGLTIELGLDGMSLSVPGETLPPLDGCPEDGPTICLKDEVEVKQQVERLRELRREDGGDADAHARDTFRTIRDAYDWRRLYHRLLEIKRDYPARTVLSVSAHESVPVGLVVRVLDVARFELQQTNYDSAEAFRDDLRHGRVAREPAGNLMMPKALFSDPSLNITN